MNSRGGGGRVVSVSVSAKTERCTYIGDNRQLGDRQGIE